MLSYYFGFIWAKIMKIEVELDFVFATKHFGHVKNVS